MNLEQYDGRFDENVNLVTGLITGKRIHTTLKEGTAVHNIRESAVYANACLDTGEQWRIERAINVIRAVLQTQDTDPESPTFGVWPYFYEEPLSRMSPPDYNWADFLGVQLLWAAIEHGKKLPQPLLADIREAVLRASQAIIRRNVAMSYTNIAVMGTYVTLIAGQFYSVPELAAYGADRLRRFCEFTRRAGGFPEYDSPTYTVIALVETARLLHHVEDPELRRLANEIYEKLWTDIATHYHAPTGQWAGPHSRAYSTFTMPGTIAFLRKSLPEGVLSAPSHTQPPPPPVDIRRVPAPCPEHLHHYFQGCGLPRNHIQAFTRENEPVVGYTRLAGSYTIASVNHGIMWEQRQNVIGYWIPGETQEPSAVRVRFLHDGHDFSSANLTSAQAEGAVLIGVSMATDGGDRHCHLDALQDGKVQASDLRLRIHLSRVKQSQPPSPFAAGRSAHMRFGNVNLMARVEEASFDARQARFEVARDGDELYLDVVFYSGPQKLLDLASAKSAYALMALVLWDDAEPAPSASPISVFRDADVLTARWTPYPPHALAVCINRMPLPYEQVRSTVFRLHE